MIFPKLAKANASDNAEEARSLIMTSLKAIVLVILPLTAGMIILAHPVTNIIYRRGEMTSESAALIAGILSCYCVGMLGLAVNEVLSKYFFSMNDSKTPMRNSILSMVFDVIMAYVLFALFKTYGLALAAAGGSIFNALLNGICMVRRQPGMIKRSDSVTFVKTLTATAIMAAVVFVIYRLIYNPDGEFLSQLMVCAVCGVVGVVIYAISLWILQVDEIRQLRKEK